MTVTRPRHLRDRSHVAPVTSREELIYLLSRASELEHGLACVYLFAAYSLKNDISEGGLTRLRQKWSVAGSASCPALQSRKCCTSLRSQTC
jgi:hypothetical protein